MLTAGDKSNWDSRPFEAKYAGFDPACEEPINVGERVLYVGSVLVHEACAASYDPTRTAGQRPTKFQGTTLEDMGF